MYAALEISANGGKSIKMRKRLDLLDVARAFGIVLVVIGHLIGAGEKNFTGSALVCKFIYSFHMPLFFMISGILLGRSRMSGESSFKEIRHWMVHRAGKLLVPYYFWSFLYFVMSVENLKNHEKVEEWLQCIFSFRGRAPIWFLGALFWAELLTVFTIRIARNDRRVIGGIALADAVAAIVMWTKYDSLPDMSLGMNYFVVFLCRELVCFFFVLAGVLIAEWIAENEYSRKSMIQLAVCAGTVCFFIFKYQIAVNLHLFNFSNLPAFFITGLFGSIAVLLFSKLLCRIMNTSLLTRIGKDSLGIMCLHYLPFPFFQYATDLCEHWEIFGLRAFAVSFCFVFGISFLLTELLKKVSLI